MLVVFALFETLRLWHKQEIKFYHVTQHLVIFVSFSLTSLGQDVWATPKSIKKIKYFDSFDYLIINLPSPRNPPSP